MRFFEISDQLRQNYLDRAGKVVDRRLDRMAQVRDRLNKGYEIYHAEDPTKIVHRFEANTPAEAKRYYERYNANYDSDVDYDLRLRRATGLIEARARYEMVDLDPWTFDQTPAGWRSLPTSARQADAIKAYIDAYVKNGQFVGAPEGAKVLRPYILYWHLGQVLTQMGRNVMAVSAMHQALDDGEPGWNAYVMATISFLRQNRKDFDHWAPLARGNEETIKRLTDGWGLPYKQAYAGNKATLRRATGIMEIARIPQGDFGDKDTLVAPKHDVEKKELPGGSGFTYAVDKTGTGNLEIMIFDGDTLAAELDLFETQDVTGAWRVETVAVNPEYRSRGLGKALYGIALSILRLTVEAGDTQTKHGRRMWLMLNSIPGVEVVGYNMERTEKYKPRPGDEIIAQDDTWTRYTFPVRPGTHSMRSARRGTGMYTSQASMLARWAGQ
jgi:hypothetical protein